jgi:hypothetical protein
MPLIELLPVEGIAVPNYITSLKQMINPIKRFLNEFFISVI